MKRKEWKKNRTPCCRKCPSDQKRYRILYLTFTSWSLGTGTSKRIRWALSFVIGMGVREHLPVARDRFLHQDVYVLLLVVPQADFKAHLIEIPG